MDDTIGLAERRQFGRRKVAFEGVIWVPCRPKISCLVSNISTMGALVELNPHVWLPAKFRLVVAGKFDVDCQLAHRTATTAGVTFLTAIADIK